jgi:hypothetical protein
MTAAVGTSSYRPEGMQFQRRLCMGAALGALLALGCVYLAQRRAQIELSHRVALLVTATLGGGALGVSISAWSRRAAAAQRELAARGNGERGHAAAPKAAASRRSSGARDAADSVVVEGHYSEFRRFVGAGAADRSKTPSRTSSDASIRADVSFCFSDNPRRRFEMVRALVVGRLSWLQKLPRGVGPHQIARPEGLADDQVEQLLNYCHTLELPMELPDELDRKIALLESPHSPADLKRRLEFEISRQINQANFRRVSGLSSLLISRHLCAYLQRGGHDVHGNTVDDLRPVPAVDLSPFGPVGETPEALQAMQEMMVTPEGPLSRGLSKQEQTQLMDWGRPGGMSC